LRAADTGKLTLSHLWLNVNWIQEKLGDLWPSELTSMEIESIVEWTITKAQMEKMDGKLNLLETNTFSASKTEVMPSSQMRLMEWESVKSLNMLTAAMYCVQTQSLILPPNLLPLLSPPLEL